MASGIYPVVSDIPANRGWLTDNRAAFFPIGDANSLAEKIQEIASHGSLPSNGVENRKIVDQLGERSTNMDTILNHIQRASQL